MKLNKLLYIGILGLISRTSVFADSITSGDVHVIVISTGLIDTSRSWGEKLNINTQIFASTLNTVISDINSLETSTSNVETRLNNLDSSTASITTRLNGHDLFRSTAQPIISSWNLYKSTGEALTSSYSLFRSTGEGRIEAFHLFKTTGESTIESWVLARSTTASVAQVNSTFTHIMQGNATSYVTINGTQTKTSGLNILGSVGIGTNSPSSKLDLANGSVTIRGTNAGISVAGNITATSYFGDGSNLSGISGGGASTGTVIHNLYVTTAADANEIVVTADQASVMDQFYFRISTKCDISKNGPGGLDTGSEAANTWYKYFLISGTTVSVIASSASNSQPIMPSGYTRWRPIGYFRNNGSSNVVGFRKQKDVVALSAGETLVNSAELTATESTLDLQDYIPPNTIEASFRISFHALSNQWGAVRFAPKGVLHANGLITGANETWGGQQGANAGGGTSTLITLPMYGTREIIYNEANTVTAFRVVNTGYREEYP